MLIKTATFSHNNLQFELESEFVVCNAEIIFRCTIFCILLR